MRKLILCFYCVALLTLSGCGKAESTMEEAEQGVATEITTEDVEETDTEEESNLPSELSKDELDLGVTLEKRDEFIEQYGIEDYEVALSSVPIYLQTLSNLNSPIKDSDIQKYQSEYTVETVEIVSSLDGHTIPADYIYSDDKNKDTVIMVHGVGENRRSLSEQTDLFLGLGYNVIAYDQRCAGDNQAELCTFGVLEQYDLLDYIKYANDIIDSDKKLVVYGKSQGGAAVGMALGDDIANEMVDYAILDCPVGSMKGMLDDEMKKRCGDDVEYVYQCGDEFMGAFLGFTFADGEVSAHICNTTVPVLIFAGAKDNIVPIEQIQSVYDAIPHDQKNLYISEESGHCGIYYNEYEQYQSLIAQLINGELFE